MNILKKLSTVNQNIWFLVILVISAFLYLYNINFSDFWIDEAFTKALVKHPFSEIAGLIKSDFHPPLYFYCLKIFVLIFGISDFTIRLFSALGVLSIIILGYYSGQRIFGKSGALYFCLLILSLPMLAAYSHEARMYSWGAFSVTGVYLFSILFIQTNKKNDLIYLMLFSLMAAYTHYYALLAAALSNIFVMVTLIKGKNRIWRVHFLYSILTVSLYSPWIYVLLGQAKNVQKSFWVPKVTWDTISSCFTSPFAQKYFLPGSLPMIIIIYCIILWVIYRNFITGKDNYKLVIGLSLFIFILTIISAILISLFLQPILYARYIVNIVVMLLIPPVVFFITTRNLWIKGVILLAIMFYGLLNLIESSSFSFGPYRQSLEYLHENHPDVKKVFHVLETTVGSFVEYNNGSIQNYWYKPDSTIVYTNMDVFYNLYSTKSLGSVLKTGEPFCVANFTFMPFNEKNFKQILSESDLIKIDTVADNKVQYNSYVLLYVLKYQGNKMNSIKE